MTFTVRDDLDEFFVTESSSDEKSDKGLEIENEQARKRDLKVQNKKTKHRRMSNSNLIIPTSDDSLSSSSDSSVERKHSKKNRKVFSEKKALVN